MKKNILIIGSGPSTKLVKNHLKKLNGNFDTFGLSLSYRFYEKINWWPTYYALADSKVILNLEKEIAKTFNKNYMSPTNIFFSYKIKNLNHTLIKHSPTGTFAIKKSIELGYKNIFLVGIHSEYVEKIPESKPLSKLKYYRLGYHKLNIPKISKTGIRVISEKVEKNPNYFVDDYQKVGDIYSLPRSWSHKQGTLDTLSQFKNKVNFYDLNPESKLGIEVYDFNKVINK